MSEEIEGPGAAFESEREHYRRKYRDTHEPIHADKVLRKITTRIAKNNDFTVEEALSAKPDGVIWVTHEELEAKDPKLVEYAVSSANYMKKTFIENGGKAKDFEAHREFPCRGKLVVTGGNNEWSIVECDECGYETSFPKKLINSDMAIESALGRSHIPQIYVGRKMEQLPGQAKARGYLRQWVLEWGSDQNKEDPTLRLPVPIVYGLPGRGKSHIICSVAETMIKRYQVNLVYWVYKDLLEDIKRGYSDPHYKTGWDRAVKCDLLVLDDFGAERPTDFALEKFSELVDLRYRSAAPILMASNIPPEDWDDMFGVRTGSRLNGMTLAVEVTGEDQRDFRLPDGTRINPDTGEVIRNED